VHRINIGCGETPTRGWLNFDNSASLKLSSYPMLSRILRKVKLVNDSQWERITFCRENTIIWANAAEKIPLPSSSVEVLYSSHMLEHLDRIEAKHFLGEARRVLAPEGIIRLAVPDIKRIIEKYAADGDADAFVDTTYMCVPRPRTVSSRIAMLLVGTRHHQWMYDGVSLCKLLTESGFAGAQCLDPGRTKIANHEPLDLCERRDESVYVEATKA
jgi:predicted SAM-dependent methyltransferase